MIGDRPIASPRTFDPGNPSPIEEEFAQLLYRGSELMAQGKLAEARDQLERAVARRPQDEKCQNLLGLAYFKLSMFDKASAVYEALVRANPADPTLRVNLGLVYLKTNSLVRAIREFQTAINLAPDHRKAHNYLGLALAQAGDYAQARDHFLMAGSDAMAEKMAQAAAEQFTGQGTEISPMAPAAAVDDGAMAEQAALAPLPFADVPPPLAEAEVSSVGTETIDWGAQLGSVEQAIGVAPPGIDWPAAHASRITAIVPPQLPPPPAPLAPLAEPVLSLRELAAALEIESRQPPSTPFLTQGSRLTICVGGQMLTRLTGMVAYCGALTFAPERKRFRDRPTDRWFGDGELQVTRVSGQGLIFLNVKDQTLTPFHLGSEPAYFREDAVFAFESTLTFENGRLPSPFASDLDLVHLRGQGMVLLSLAGMLRSVQVTPQNPATIPLDGLIGWQGPLTPRVAPILADEEGNVQRAGLELNGQGYALFAVPLS